MADERTSLVVVRALMEGTHDTTNPVLGFVQVMLSGFGYNFRDAANVARANDQLVRTRAAELVGEGATAIGKREVAYREANVPPSTREQPFPPAEIMASLKQIHALHKRVEALASSLLTLEAPGNDRIWARLRSEGEVLEKLLASDIGMVVLAHDLSDAARALTASASVKDIRAAVETPAAALEEVLHDRRALFAILS